MRTKLHFGIIIVLLALLGRLVETPATPNQEITIQFSDANISEIEAQNTLRDIQQKLQRIGAENLLVIKDDSGSFKIAYYSLTDAQSIEQILTDSSEFSFLLGVDTNNSNKKSDEDTVKDYKLNVSEIQKKDQKNDWDFDRVQITEHNQKSDRFNKLEKDVFSCLYQSDVLQKLVKATFRFNSGIFYLEDKKSYQSPEVRAGPNV